MFCTVHIIDCPSVEYLKQGGLAVGLAKQNDFEKGFGAYTYSQTSNLFFQVWIHFARYNIVRISI